MFPDRASDLLVDRVAKAMFTRMGIPRPISVPRIVASVQEESTSSNRNALRKWLMYSL